MSLQRLQRPPQQKRKTVRRFPVRSCPRHRHRKTVGRHARHFFGRLVLLQHFPNDFIRREGPGKRRSGQLRVKIDVVLFRKPPHSSFKGLVVVRQDFFGGETSPVSFAGFGVFGVPKCPFRHTDGGRHCAHVRVPVGF